MRGEYAGENIKNRFNEELPPRARRILSIRPINQQDNGTTSACAENTTPAPQIIHVWWNYLRVRGEYRFAPPVGVPYPELPPRARRIRVALLQKLVKRGTTSACAENTHKQHIGFGNLRNYLRVRGEYEPETGGEAYIPELPPRARRIHHGRYRHAVCFGTTSACAENTFAVSPRPRTRGNYLRVRGEYVTSYFVFIDPMELPPRARRILVNVKIRSGHSGTTSACAENTHVRHIIKETLRNYLRVRGEYLRGVAPAPHPWELPPRARRIHEGDFLGSAQIGTTSACAENTAVSGVRSRCEWNYLRVRGEYLRLIRKTRFLLELPPRARRIRNF